MAAFSPIDATLLGIGPQSTCSINGFIRVSGDDNEETASPYTSLDGLILSQNPSSKSLNAAIVQTATRHNTFTGGAMKTVFQELGFYTALSDAYTMVYSSDDPETKFGPLPPTDHTPISFSVEVYDQRKKDGSTAPIKCISLSLANAFRDIDNGNGLGGPRFDKMIELISSLIDGPTVFSFSEAGRASGRTNDDPQVEWTTLWGRLVKATGLKLVNSRPNNSTERSFSLWVCATPSAIDHIVSSTTTQLYNMGMDGNFIGPYDEPFDGHFGCVAAAASCRMPDGMTMLNLWFMHAPLDFRGNGKLNGIAMARFQQAMVAYGGQYIGCGDMNTVPGALMDATLAALDGHELHQLGASFFGYPYDRIPYNKTLPGLFDLLATPSGATTTDVGVEGDHIANVNDMRDLSGGAFLARDADA